MDKPPHHSPDVVMTPHHIFGYAWVEGRKEAIARWRISSKSGKWTDSQYRQ
jgi:hypothetical protein